MDAGWRGFVFLMLLAESDKCPGVWGWNPQGDCAILGKLA
jgi:hypothetical protein